MPLRTAAHITNHMPSGMIRARSWSRSTVPAVLPAQEQALASNTSNGCACSGGILAPTLSHNRSNHPCSPENAGHLRTLPSSAQHVPNQCHHYCTLQLMTSKPRELEAASTMEQAHCTCMLQVMVRRGFVPARGSTAMLSSCCQQRRPGGSAE